MFSLSWTDLLVCALVAIGVPLVLMAIAAMAGWAFGRRD